MMITTTLLVTGALASTVTGTEVRTEVDVPSVYVSGRPFRVEVTYTAGPEGGEIETWKAGPAAFELNGQPLAERPAGPPAIELVPDGGMSWFGDLSGLLAGRGVSGDFTLTVGDASVQVRAFDQAPAGLDFMSLPLEELDDYMVLIRTNRGDMLVEFFPDVAPNHVRNFLDLSYTAFYEGILFHRVSPTFMIQGGCPNTLTDNKTSWGTGKGPRMLDAEFSDKKHVRGVLSMARGPSPNSASSQFFVITQTSAFLDGQYSVFGRMVTGDETLDRISKAPGRANPRDGTIRPSEPQRVEQTLVLQHISGS